MSDEDQGYGPRASGSPRQRRNEDRHMSGYSPLRAALHALSPRARPLLKRPRSPELETSMGSQSQYAEYTATRVLPSRNKRRHFSASPMHDDHEDDIPVVPEDDGGEYHERGTRRASQYSPASQVRSKWRSPSPVEALPRSRFRSPEAGTRSPVGGIGVGKGGYKVGVGKGGYSIPSPQGSKPSRSTKGRPKEQMQSESSKTSTTKSRKPARVATAKTGTKRARELLADEESEDEPFDVPHNGRHSRSASRSSPNYSMGTPEQIPTSQPTPNDTAKTKTTVVEDAPPPPKKKKLPTIKKNKGGAVTAGTSTPAAKTPSVAGILSVPVVVRKPANTAGNADLDLSNPSVYANLFSGGPRAGGINHREKEEQRRKELDKMRDEARAKRQAECPHPFDMQAQWDKITYFEEPLQKRAVIWPNMIASKAYEMAENEKKAKAKARQQEEAEEKERQMMLEKKLMREEAEKHREEGEELPESPALPTRDRERGLEEMRDFPAPRSTRDHWEPEYDGRSSSRRDDDRRRDDRGGDSRRWGLGRPTDSYRPSNGRDRR